MSVLAHLITILAACVLTLAGSLLLFFSLKRELARLRAETAGIEGKWEAEAAELRRALQVLAQEVEEERKAALDRVAGPKQSMNLSKRSLALRMHRMGESPDKIAAGLGISRREVELLLKVHRTVLETVTGRGAAAAGG
jgi:DNA-binding NarL/FixJ family response regulator